MTDKVVAYITQRELPFTFHPMNEADARATLEWRYDAPYDLYNVAPDDVEKETKSSWRLS